ncbi:inositol monophosphatase family protein [Neisseria shayeganii]|uniref:Inositol-1-monophosphatase n=1 Tax=Neisseria shayeganii TaxID=607712 RepID=A0A7D7RV81_9NEIS|nr:inositol monophosphatase family protein [Neisseria shayeganii]QMT40624.1 inositol monophosphatase [Neisseria shayeganii]
MNPVLNTAFKAARRAGDMMMRAANNLSAVKVDSKAFNDFVSEIDRNAEAIISDILLEAYPQHRITAEEGGSRGNPRAEYEWIIDPLDGTTNYLHGHPQYAISMALLHKGVLQEALVYAPERNDLYMASRGKGALLNDRRIRVSNRIEMNRSLIGTGFPVVDQSMMDRYLAILRDFLAKTAGARREGAASLDLCAVACGRFDGFFEFNLKPWDIAAGALIVQEAGGIVTDLRGNEGWLESGDIVAANPKVLAQMLKIIAPHLPADSATADT